MAENKDNLSKNEVTAPDEVTQSSIENTEHSDALSSFLERETSDVMNKKDDNKKPKKLSKNAMWFLIAAVAVVLITALIVILVALPSEKDQADLDPGTPLSLSVDENGEHQAEVILNSKGKLDNNSYGTLIEYTPSQISKIEVENSSGNFTILAQTPVTVNEETGEEETDATIYTLVGFEDINLATGGPDTIANDVASLTFNSVADPVGDKSADFGFDKPRATVKTTYTDDTTATIIVGNEAPSQAGTYVMFGDSKVVYVVSNDAVDGLLFSVLDLVSLEINTAAANTENAEFESLSLSGEAYSTTIELRPNDDKAIDTSYKMIAPKKMFVSEVEAANITGAIRGLTASEAICVNPSSSQLSEYGLSTPYAELSAVYPDTSVNLKLSKPSDDMVYIIGDSNIIYSIEASKVPWVYTTLDKLTPDTVIDPNFESLSQIEVTDSSGTYVFDITTSTESVENTDGALEDVSSTTATYNGKKLDSDNFYVFYQNICAMENAGKANDSGSGSVALEIKLSYSTGRATDTVTVYSTGNTKYVATLNGNVQSLVYKSYCTKFSQCVQDLIMGKTVGSF
ncbi:MAG: DUF4340 domain-containing protein [Ruminococcus sp.]|nr:DUF4340 domain-containing protein [Ruminococcus sp.]